MKTHLIAGLAALTLLGACASAAAAPAVSSNISMSDLDRKELKQWNVVDGKGQETSVSIYNVSTGVDVDKDLFEIDYQPVIGESGRRSGR